MAEGTSAPASGGTVIGALAYDPPPFTPEQEARIAEIVEAAIAQAEQRRKRSTEYQLRTFL